MNLYRLTVRKKYEKINHLFYVIKRSKDEAEEYLSNHLNSEYEIIKCCHLGNQLSGIMFKKVNKGINR